MVRPDVVATEPEYPTRLALAVRHRRSDPANVPTGVRPVNDGSEAVRTICFSCPRSAARRRRRCRHPPRVRHPSCELAPERVHRTVESRRPARVDRTHGSAGGRAAGVRTAGRATRIGGAALCCRRPGGSDRALAAACARLASASAPVPAVHGTIGA
jgi:hypothetical protein